jgi:hypothetical protein
MSCGDAIAVLFVLFAPALFLPLGVDAGGAAGLFLPLGVEAGVPAGHSNSRQAERMSLGVVRLRTCLPYLLPPPTAQFE